MKKCGLSVFISLWFVILAAASAHAGGLIAYEVGTADVGLASAGYNARAQAWWRAPTTPARCSPIPPA